MVKRLMVFLLLGTMTLLAAPPNPKPKGDGTLPDELLQIAKELGCGPVPGFYDSPGDIDPPYLYGWPPKNKKEETAVFWCHRKHKEEPYLLVFVEDLGSGRKGRVAYTSPSEYEPGGLSIFDWPNINFYGREDEGPYDPKHLPLDPFVYIDNPKEHGPKGKTTEYAPLQDSYDGISTLYYRHEGRWLWLGLD